MICRPCSFNYEEHPAVSQSIDGPAWGGSLYLANTTLHAGLWGINAALTACCIHQNLNKITAPIAYVFLPRFASTTVAIRPPLPAFQIPNANIPLPVRLISSSASSSASSFSPSLHSIVTSSLSTHTHTLHTWSVSKIMSPPPLPFFSFTTRPGPEVASVSTIRPYNGW